MNLKNFFKRDKKIKIDDELVSTVGITNFFNLDGTTWNPENVSIATYKKMSNHYQVASALAVISYSIQQIDWFIQSDDEKVKEVLTFAIDRIWNRLIRSASKSFIYGYSPNVKVFTIENINGTDYIIYKKIKDLDPADCVVRTDEYGEFDGFVYKDGTIDKTIVDPEYSFWYVSNMENGNLYGLSMLKKVYKPWWYSEKIHTFANRYYERFGEPLVVGRAPSGAKVKNADGTVKDAQVLMNEIIANIRNHSSVQLPSDKAVDGNDFLYDLKYIESQMRGFDFGDYLTRLDSEITKGLLLPELALGGGKGGSYALGSAQIDVFYTNLSGIMDNIVDYVNLYLIPQLIKYNFGENKSAKFTYQPISMETKKFVNDLIMKMVEGSKLKPDTSQLEERSGIKLEEQKVEKVVQSKVSPADIKKIANKETKMLISLEKETKLNKGLEEVEKIKQDLISLYPNE